MLKKRKCFGEKRFEGIVFTHGWPDFWHYRSATISLPSIT